MLGLDFGNYLTGSILTETIFSWPGLGRYVVNAISRRDLPAIQGSVLFLSLVFVLVNLMTDLAVREGGSASEVRLDQSRTDELRNHRDTERSRGRRSAVCSRRPLYFCHP